MEINYTEVKQNAKKGRPFGTGDATDLATRMCKRGHVGDWVERKGQSSCCRKCQAIGVREWRARQGMKPTIYTARKALDDLKIEQERLTNDLAKIMMKIAIQEVKIAVEEKKAEVK